MTMTITIVWPYSNLMDAVVYLFAVLIIFKNICFWKRKENVFDEMGWFSVEGKRILSPIILGIHIHTWMKTNRSTVPEICSDGRFFYTW